MNKLSQIISTVLTLIAIASLFAIPANAADSKGTLVWSDEFDGTSLNTKNWVYDVGYGYWGNNELEYYRSGTNNIQVADGYLAITAKKESYGGASYTSGRITSLNKQHFKYGTMEARIKMPVGQGLWPAFWMLSESASWPNGGEIDIMEHINSETIVYGTGHDWNNGNTKSKGGELNNIDVTQFHTYRVDWTEESITWLVDDKEYFTLDISSDNGFFPNTEVFHEPYYFLLNVAVGGSWPGDPVNSSFPATMYVDYVRVYDGVPVEEEPEPEPDESYYVFKMNTSKAYVSLTDTVEDLVQPCVYDNYKAYLPFRATAYATGCPTVSYNQNTKKITLVNSFGTEFLLTIGSSLVNVKLPDGTTAVADIQDAPLIINNNTYLPVRAVSNLVGGSLKYYDSGYVTVSKIEVDDATALTWIQKAVAAFNK